MHQDRSRELPQLPISEVPVLGMGNPRPPAMKMEISLSLDQNNQSKQDPGLTVASVNDRDLVINLPISFLFNLLSIPELLVI
ncbi:MAG: hypothetical protein CL912_01225 [Deltaproteobacteria bacterium]|nr:hypothetical protein [Deltaproteobacteria bacterium]